MAAFTLNRENRHMFHEAAGFPSLALAFGNLQTICISFVDWNGRVLLHLSIALQAIATQVMNTSQCKSNTSDVMIVFHR